MSEKKRACWMIRARSITVEKVYFDEPVTKEDAEAIYESGQWDDIQDMEIVETLSVESVY